MRRWIHSLMILYSILGLCQLQPLIQESEQLASQWVEIVQGEVKGSSVGEDGKPVIAQLRFFDSDGALIKRIQTDIDGNFEIMAVPCWHFYFEGIFSTSFTFTHVSYNTTIHKFSPSRFNF